MDAAAYTALSEMVRSTISRDLDELHVRIDRLERRADAPRSFTYRGHLAERREAVVELRSAGLSMAAVADRLGVAVSTVERDLDAVPHEAPAYVTGRDGKTHPSRKNGSRSTAA